MNGRTYDITTASETSVQWLVEDSDYVKWQKSDKGMLWIKGKPGSGKSTLMKFISSQDVMTQNSRDSMLVAFFFNSRGVELQRTLPGFFRMLLYHLINQVKSLQSRFLDHCRLKQASQKTTNGELEWNLNELRDIVTSYIPRALETTRLKIYADALDECVESAAVDLSTYLENLILESSTNGIIHICIACRYYPILDSLTGLHIVVENRNTMAIATHVNETLAKKFSMSLASKEVNAIKHDINERASGVFQWVVLVLGITASLRRMVTTLDAFNKKSRSYPADWTTYTLVSFKGLKSVISPKLSPLYGGYVSLKGPCPCLRYSSR